MKQLLSALVLVAAVSLALPLVAFADNIENDLDGSADSTLEVLSLLVTDAPRTVTFRARPRNGDGRNGCNLGTQGTQLVVSVSSSDRSVVSVSPAELTRLTAGARSFVDAPC